MQNTCTSATCARTFYSATTKCCHLAYYDAVVCHYRFWYIPIHCQSHFHL